MLLTGTALCVYNIIRMLPVAVWCLSIESIENLHVCGMMLVSLPVGQIAFKIVLRPALLLPNTAETVIKPIQS
jgi:hypothetical protein